MEKNIIRIFTIYAAIVTSVWQFQQFYLKIPAPKKFTRYQQMVDIADSLVQIKNSIFMKQVGLI